MITAGEAQDLKAYEALMDETSPFPKVLLADRGYGANAVHADVENRGGVLMFPTKKEQAAADRDRSGSLRSAQSHQTMLQSSHERPPPRQSLRQTRRPTPLATPLCQQDLVVAF